MNRPFVEKKDSGFYGIGNKIRKYASTKSHLSVSAEDRINREPEKKIIVKLDVALQNKLFNNEKFK